MPTVTLRLSKVNVWKNCGVGLKKPKEFVHSSDIFQMTKRSTLVKMETEVVFKHLNKKLMLYFYW